MPDQTDPVLAEITAAAELFRAGDTAAARDRFAATWESIGADGDPFHRCVLAHYAADAQAEPHEELWWDQRALEAADQVVPGTTEPDVAGFYPSLHLNLADVHRRLGHLTEATHHIERAREVVDLLPDDGYGRMIRDGITRCAARLDAPDAAQ